MSGRQGAESGRGRERGDPTTVAGIGVGEVPTEASSGLEEVAGLGRRVDEREAVAAGGQVLPRGTEHAELDELLLARHVQRERGGERTADVQAPDRVAKGRADLPLAHLLRNDDEEVRKPGELLLLRPSRREPQVPLELPGERAERLGTPVVLQVELACTAGMQ